MRDEEIVARYWRRDETALQQTQEKYESGLLKVAYNILCDREDSRESVNDTYLRAWNSMPPHRPQILFTYLCRITRHLSIDRYRKRNSQKRQASEYACSLSELEDCISAGNVTEQEVDLHLLAAAIQDYLRTLPQEARDIFVGRYYFADSLREVASYYDMSESKVKSMLYRIRRGLRGWLEKEGFFGET